MSSDDAGFSDEASLQLKLSLQRFIEKMVRPVAGPMDVTTGYVEALTSLIYQFASRVVARDLIAFRDHAGRKNITEEDVILMARKAGFHDHLKKYLSEELGVTRDDAPKKRGRTPRLEQFAV